MQNQDPISHRPSPEHVVEHRRAASVLRPFLADLSHWNRKAAYLRARADSFYGTEEERVLARLEGGALLAEVRRRHTELRAAVKGEPAHSRIDDVDSAFRRLIDQLRTVTAVEGLEASRVQSTSWGTSRTSKAEAVPRRQTPRT